MNCTGALNATSAHLRPYMNTRDSMTRLRAIIGTRTLVAKAISADVQHPDPAFRLLAT
jgi:hypothetical protein